MKFGQVIRGKGNQTMKFGQVIRGKGNQTMKFGQVIEYNKRNISLQKPCRKRGRDTSSRRLFVFLKKAFIWGKSKWSAASFQHILIVLNLTYNKSQLYKTFDYWSRDILNFDFLQKGLGIVSAPHFEYVYSRNISHVMFY